MSYNTYSILFNLLKNKYRVPIEASYYEAIEIMKKNGISTEELIALHEVWGDLVEKPHL